MRLRSIPALVALATAFVVTGCSKSADTTSPTDTGKDSAILACKVFAEIPPDGFDPTKDQVSVHRVSSVHALVLLAKSQDQGYSDLSAKVVKMTSLIQSTFSASGESWQQVHADVKGACDKVQ